MSATSAMTDRDRALLVRTLRIQTVSGETAEMRGHIRAECSAIGATVEEDDVGNLYVTRGIADCYPCLVAHTDTVHDIINPSDYQVYHDRKKDDLWSLNKATGQATGIGGDDKAGVFIALAMVRDLVACKAFFPVDEEIGCVGSRAADLDWFGDVSVLIQCDRAGAGEIVGDIYGRELMGDALRRVVNSYRQAHGLRYVSGSLTDVYTLVGRGVGVGGFNLACGYHAPHSRHEYVNVPELARTHAFVRDIAVAIGGHRWAHSLPVEIVGEDGYADWTDAVWRDTDYLARWADDRPRCSLCTRRVGVTVDGICRWCLDTLDGVQTEASQPHRSDVRCWFCGARGAPSVRYDPTEDDWFCWSCFRYQSPAGDSLIALTGGEQ